MFATLQQKSNLCNSSQCVRCRNRPHTVYIHLTLQTKWQSMYNYSVLIHVFTILDSNSVSISVTYLHIYIFHPCARLPSVFMVPEYSCWCTNFTHVYSCVQSLVMVSCTVRALWLQSVYVSVEYQSFQKTFPPFNQTVRHNIRQYWDSETFFLTVW